MNVNPEESGLETLIASKYKKEERKVWILMDEPEILLMRALRHGFLDDSELWNLYSQGLLPKSLLANGMVEKVVIVSSYRFEIPNSLFNSETAVKLVN